MLPSTRLAGVAAVLACVAAAAGCGSETPQRAATSAAALPDVALISCDADGATLRTPRVRPQRDGVHLRFENEAGRPLDYSIQGDGGGGGSSVPESGVTEVLALPPGSVDIRCTDPTSDADPGGATPVTLQIVDSPGIWTPSVVGSSCDGTVTVQGRFAEGARGESGPPEVLARRSLEERGVLRSDDVVEPAGYPDQAEQVARLVRDGDTIAVIHYMDDGHGGLLLSRVDACEGIGFG